MSLLLAIAVVLGAEPPVRSLEWPQDQVSLIVDTTNDNHLLGVWGALGGRDGDDFGHTYGLRLGARTVVSGLRLAVEASTDLYTRRIGTRANRDDDRGIYTVQHFANHDRLVLSVDAVPAWRGASWAARVGWESVTSQRPRLVTHASGQQLSWHGFLNDLDPVGVINPDYVPDGSRPKHGVFAEGDIGWVQVWSVAPAVALRVGGSVGAHLSTLAHATQGLGRVEGALLVQRSRRAPALRLTAAVDLRLHDRGATVRPEVELRFGHAVLSVWLRLARPLGDLSAITPYDLPHRRRQTNDSVTIVGVRIGIPTRKPTVTRGSSSPAP